MPYTYEFPRPAVTTDCVPVRFLGGALEILLVRRDRPPFEGAWAFPGGFLEMDEDLEPSARRELEEETGIRDAALRQIATVGTPGRDPRGRVVTVVYLALVRPDRSEARAGSDAREVRWFPLERPPRLAFDHDRILALARRRLAERLEGTLEALELLPDVFPLEDLERIHAAALGCDPDRDLLRRRFVDSGLLVPDRSAGTSESTVLYRRASGTEREKGAH